MNILTAQMNIQNGRASMPMAAPTSIEEARVNNYKQVQVDKANDCLSAMQDSVQFAASLNNRKEDLNPDPSVVVIIDQPHNVRRKGRADVSASMQKADNSGLGVLFPGWDNIHVEQYSEHLPTFNLASSRTGDGEHIQYNTPYENFTFETHSNGTLTMTQEQIQMDDV